MTLWSGIFLGFAGLFIVLLALASTRAWWNTRALFDVDIGWRRFLPGAFGAGIRDAVASRKLRRIVSDFQALKSFRDNGVISEEVFEERKNALRDSIASR